MSGELLIKIPESQWEPIVRLAFSEQPEQVLQALRNGDSITMEVAEIVELKWGGYSRSVVREGYKFLPKVKE